MKAAVRIAALVSGLASFTTAASAQVSPATQEETADPGESARFRFGPLRFTPSIAVTNIGIDDNVFNEASDPKQDTTAGVGPEVGLWIHLGRARVSGKAGGQYLYFKTYDNQRAWNTSNDLRLDLPLARLKPFIAGSYVNTRDRPGYEIDSRARAATNKLMLGTALRISGKTTFIFSGSRATTAFDTSDSLGAQLAKVLNRRSDTEQLQFRYALTPLTTLVVNNEAIQDRFDFEGTRNADSIRVMPGFEFKPFALVSGSVFVGVRHFNALDEAIPDFDGVAARVDAKYTVAATRIEARIDRDLEFSFEDVSPYYALTDVKLVLTERVTRGWDVVGKIGWQALGYRHVQSFPSAAQTDTGRQSGLGAGYRFGEILRLGLDVNYLQRRSLNFRRQYDGFRVGASVSYGQAQ